MYVRVLSPVLLLSAILFADDASAHTLFVKPESFVVDPETMVSVNLIDGTFLKSENRLRQSTTTVEIIGPGNTELDFANDDWVSVNKMSVLSAEFPKPGNYLIGAETRPRKVSLDAETFNYYLRYEGLYEQKEEREQLGETDTAAVEQFTKFAKALVQVGNVDSSNFATELGHEVEIVPITNPYTLEVGDNFRARVLRDGSPIEGMRVYATHEGYLPQDEEGIYDEAVKVRSDADGIIEFEISDPGKWYVRFIDLQRESDSEYWYSGLLVSLGADEKRIVYQSKWATLSFEIKQAHEASADQ